MAKDENKELVPVFGGLPVDITESERLVKAMEDTAQEGGRNGDVSFMNFSGKKGKYSIGVEGREPGAQEPFLVAVTGFELGYICWKGGKPIAKRMASITQPAIPQPDPDEFGPFEKDADGWSRARAITVRSLENEEQCYFANNSKSGVAVMSDLQKEVLDRMKAGQPAWPIVIFGEEEFTSNDYKNSKPVIDVIQWVSTEQVEALADPEYDPMSLLEEAPEKQAPAPEPKRRENRRRL